jgi:hypothetical protein
VLYAGRTRREEQTCDESFAGIGGAYEGIGGTVTIYGGTVTAIGENDGMGIGAGSNGNDNGSLTLGEGVMFCGGASEDSKDEITQANDDYARYKYMISGEAESDELLAEGRTVKQNDDGSYSVEENILVTFVNEATLENAANNKIRITINTSDISEELVSRTGAIIYRGTEQPDVMTIESAAATADIYDYSSNGTSFSTTLKDKFNSVYYVGYTILADGTVKYGEVQHTSVSGLSVLRG